MDDELNERLRGLGSRPAPPPTQEFLDGLESRLRAEHPTVQAARPSRSWLPRLGLASVFALLVLGGVLAITQQRTGTPDGSLDVATAGEGGEGDTSPPAPGQNDPPPPPSPTPVPAGGGVAEDPEPTVAPTATPERSSAADPRPTALPVGPVPTVRPSVVTSTPTPGAPAGPTVAPTEIPTATPTAESTPTTTPTSPPASPTPDPSPTPTATPPPTVTPSATVTPEPASIDRFVCAQRTTDAGTAVACEWGEPPAGAADLVERWRLWRTANGAAREVVGRYDPQVRLGLDRAITPSDEIIYVLQALAGDRVIAQSAPILVLVRP